MSDSDTGGCPVDHGQTSECPVKHGNEVVDKSINDVAYGQNKQPGQTVDLSTRRAVSHIDRSNITPHHQVAGVDKWVYPSEQQYYNAMKRKGYNPDAKDVPVILAIHNTVNEQSWAMVREWESKYTPNPKLKKFMGRPKDLSPKAFLLSLLGYSKPFDRHDWVIDRNGEEVRYVIDFYRGQTKRPVLTLKPEAAAAAAAAGSSGDGSAETKTAPRSLEPAMSIYLDVRPALDSYGALRDRLIRGVSTQFYTMQASFDLKAEARGAVTWLKELFPLDLGSGSKPEGKK